MTQKENSSCQCTRKSCVDCKRGCSKECCTAKPSVVMECPFLKTHPNWQKCPFMSKMFMTPTNPIITNTDSNTAMIDHSSCDESKCSKIPMTQCTSCHKTPAFTHTVTLAMDTDVAADQGEDQNL